MPGICDWNWEPETENDETEISPDLPGAEIEQPTWPGDPEIPAVPVPPTPHDSEVPYAA